ncbi:MAG: hypothetical protein LBL23_06110 [Coriobacteriales bacterium]|jgi:hypothetical protein|nr:hypothetical protein [Coriobacteriales bacterium]
MRKLSRKVITSAGIFGLVIVLISSMFVFNVVTVYATSVGSYPVPAASLVYDQNDQPVATTQDSTIELRNSTDYYLKAGSTESMIPLGYNPLAYNVNGRELGLFSSNAHRIYQVFNDGSVRQVDQYAQISDFENTAFYKLSDRHYLFVGPGITNEDGLVNAQNFLYVVLDRLGNVTVMNDKYNTKFLDQVTLSCNSVTFDVNHESLVLDNGLNVDLTKIAGSTSLYKDVDENGNPLDTNPSEIIISGGNGGSGGSGGTGGTGGIGGYGGEGGSGGTGGTGGAGGSGSGGGYNFKMRSALSLMGAEPQVNKMEVDYAVMDPAMLLGSVFVTVAPTVSDTSSGTPLPTYRQELNIEQYKATVYDLNPGTMYTVALGCKEYATGLDTVVDVLKVTTPAIDYKVNVLKVGLTGVNFNVKLDSTFVLDQNNSNGTQPAAVLYGNNSLGSLDEVGRIPLNIAAAIGSEGWTAEIRYADGVIRSEYSNFTIKLEDTFFQGAKVSLQSGVYGTGGASFSVSKVFSVEIPTDPATPGEDDANAGAPAGEAGTFAANEGSTSSTSTSSQGLANPPGA